MNEFSKIKLPSGTYTVKDSSARETSNSALSKATQNESDIETLQTNVGNIKNWNITYSEDIITFTEGQQNGS